MNSISRVFFFRPKWLVWVFRFFLTFNLIIPGFNFEHHLYPLDVLVIAVIAYWLDLGKLTVFSIILLMLTTWINVEHYIYQYHE